jgi:hypothetical protein
MYREVSVIEARELLRVWMSGVGLRQLGALAGVDRKTARRYTNAAELPGLDRDGDNDQLTDELIGAAIEAVCRTPLSGECARICRWDSLRFPDGIRHDRHTAGAAPRLATAARR